MAWELMSRQSHRCWAAGGDSARVPRLQNPCAGSSGGLKPRGLGWGKKIAGGGKTTRSPKLGAPRVLPRSCHPGPATALLPPSARWRLREQREKRAQGLRAPRSPIQRVLI